MPNEVLPGVAPRRTVLPLAASQAQAGGAQTPATGIKRTSLAPATSTADPAAETKGALTQLRSGVRWLINGPSVSSFKTLETLRNPSTRYATDRTELQNAIQHVASSKDAEAAALTALGSRASGYNTIAALLVKQPIARDVLLKMLLDGRLTSLKDLSGGHDALTYLSLMAKQPLPPPMDRTELLSSVIQEMDDPVKIAQADKGTCAATTSTVVLVRKSPAEYARLVQQLASPAAQTTTFNGKIISRNADWADSNDGDRTPSMRMLEPALMQLGGMFRGVFHYDNHTDNYVAGADKEDATVAAASTADDKSFLDKLQDLAKLPGGLETAGTNRVLEALTGDKYTMIYGVTRFNRESAWTRIEASLAAGKAVPCGLTWEDGGHEVLLDKIQGGFAYFNNPWGESDRMSVAEFKGNLDGVNLPH